MKKMILFAVLAGGIGTLSFPDAPAAAQTKKATPDAKTGKIEIKEGKKDHKFRFVIHDADGDFLCTSAPFKTEKDAMDGIEDLKKVLANTKPTVLKGTHDEDEKMETKGDKKKSTDK